MYLPEVSTSRPVYRCSRKSRKAWGRTAVIVPEYSEDHIMKTVFWQSVKVSKVVERGRKLGKKAPIAEKSLKVA